VKRLKYIFITTLAILGISQLSIASDLAEQGTPGFRVVCHNEDIGPVKDGHFMRDQKYLVEEGIAGKRPGSGLFNICQGQNNTNENCFPLFNMYPLVTALLTDGSVVSSALDPQLLLSKVERRHPHALGLPGDTNEIVLPGVHPSKINAIMVQLYTWQRGFTTGGGSVWVTNTIKPTAISKLMPFIPDREMRKVLGGTNRLFVNFAWPSTGPYQEENYIDPDVIQVTMSHHEKHNNISREQLDPNWKTTLGMHTDVNNLQETANGYMFPCFPARNFNRPSDGASKNTDMLGLGKDFPYFAGHALEVSIWKQDE